ncbi:hypothetical protein [Streptomyces sp. NPDC088812]|uniref:hypothetical protein n=1 Tax=Streptomyces sp. NPDC088812 TaxID=3365905 RepID=UPI0038007BC2
MAGNLRQGDVQATRNGIQALESAFTGVVRSRQDVEATRNNLAAGYKGSDGLAYANLLQEWEKQAVVIGNNLKDMIDSLNTTLSAMHQDQGSSNEAINQAYQASSSVFDQMMGTAS